MQHPPIRASRSDWSFPSRRAVAQTSLRVRWAKSFRRRTGQPVVVDNRGGGTTIGGTDAVAKAAPDGYTLLLATSGHVINPSFFAKLPFDAIRDFAPITQLTSQAYMLGIYPGCRRKQSRI